MSALALIYGVYAVVPGLGAAASGYFIAGWQAAAVVALVALTSFGVLARLAPFGAVLLPLLVGAGLGAASLVPILLVRPAVAQPVRSMLAGGLVSLAGVWLVVSNPGIV